MNKIAFGLAALTLAAAPALAQTPMNFADVDTDASGELSFVELQAVWPDITQDEFNTVDLDMNGSLNAAELDALQPSAAPAPAPMEGDAMAPAPMEGDTMAPMAPVDSEDPGTPNSLLDTTD